MMTKCDMLALHGKDGEFWPLPHLRSNSLWGRIEVSSV